MSRCLAVEQPCAPTVGYSRALGGEEFAIFLYDERQPSDRSDFGSDKTLYAALARGRDCIVIMDKEYGELTSARSASKRRFTQRRHRLPGRMIVAGDTLIGGACWHRSCS
jgi:hypothetical protein